MCDQKNSADYSGWYEEFRRRNCLVNGWKAHTPQKAFEIMTIHEALAILPADWRKYYEKTKGIEIAKILEEFQELKKIDFNFRLVTSTVIEILLILAIGCVSVIRLLKSDNTEDFWYFWAPPLFGTTLFISVGLLWLNYNSKKWRRRVELEQQLEHIGSEIHALINLFGKHPLSRVIVEEMQIETLRIIGGMELLVKAMANEASEDRPDFIGNLRIAIGDLDDAEAAYRNAKRILGLFMPTMPLSQEEANRRARQLEEVSDVT